MNKKIVSIIIILMVIVFIVPQITFASWWNPFSWNWNSMFHRQNINKNPNIIGGDKDAHGCLIAAGYSWCEAKQKCLRTWEEVCEGAWWYDQNLNMCRQKAIQWDDEVASLGYYKTAQACQNANTQPSQTEGWKTYTNTQKGFSMKYPSSWTYEEWSPSEIGITTSGVAFCPIRQGLTGCGVLAITPPIQLYWEGSELTSKNKLILENSDYKDIYTKMLSTFTFIK